MRWKVLGLVIVLALAAGCVAGMDPGEDPSEASPTGTSEDAGQEIVEVFVFEEQIEQPQLGGDALDARFPLHLGADVLEMEVRLSWGEQVNSLGVDVETPDGTHQVDPPEDPAATSVRGQIGQASPGAFAFELTSRDGVVVMDEARLEVEVTFLVTGGEGTSTGDGVPRGPVNVEETSDGYRAWRTYEAQAEASPSMEVFVDTVNGEVQHDGTSEQAQGLVTAWARGDTPGQARERLDEIDVTLVVREDRIEASASAPDWDDRGADVDTGVPATTTIQGTFSTTNGPIVFDQARVDGVSASTTNGAVQGEITGQGSLDLGTTNGGIDVAFTPTGSASVDASTTNGGIDLALSEDDETGYRIDASTTNGAITESMEEASLNGSDQQATLETTSYGSRSIQVTGTTSTTNGDVHFAGR